MVSRRGRASIVASVSDPLTPALAAIAKAVPPGDVPEFRKRFYDFLRRVHQSSVAQPRKKKMIAQDPTADQVNGKRRHAKRVWSDYYTGDENSRNKVEGNDDAVTQSRRHSIGKGRDSLETPHRARSPSRVAPKSAPTALSEPDISCDNPHARGNQGAAKAGGANPYAKSYGKEGPIPKQGATKPVARVNSAASLKGSKGGSGAKPVHRPRGGSSSTQISAADHLAANTRALLNETDATEVDAEHEAGESFWRSLVPCFRLICPEDAKALQSRGVDPAKDPMLRKCPLGLDYSLRWVMEDLVDLEGLDEYLEGVHAPVSADQLTECALSGLTGNPQLCGKRAVLVCGQQAAVSNVVAANTSTAAAAGSELPVCISDKEENLAVVAPGEELGRCTSVESISVGPKPTAMVASAQDEILEDLVFLQQQLRTTVVCNDASRRRLRKCATAAMQRQQLLWRKWRYWYEVDRHYRWRQRMSQVHKLIIKNRTNKKDNRKAADRCVVSDLNHVDKHLAEYAHGWRPEQRATELDENLDLESVDQMLHNLKQRKQVPPNVAKQLHLAQEATQKDFGLVRHHLHDTLQLLCNTLHREIVKKELVAVEMQSLEHRVDIAQNAKISAPKAQPQPAQKAIDDELCVQVGGHQNASRPGGSKPSVVKPGQARPGQPLPSVAKPGQPRPGSHQVDHDPLKPCVSLSFMEALCVGEKVDCLDCENRWGRGMVQQVFEDGVLIHWEGFKKALDEKILFVEHLRCTKPGSHVPEKLEHKPKIIPKAPTKRGRSVEDDEDEDEVPAKLPKSDAQEDLNGRSRRGCSSIYRRT